MIRKIIRWIGRMLRKEQPSVDPPSIVVQPIYERFSPRPCPEYSRLNESLVIQGMTAEDGSLWILRDRNSPGFPVVEVRVDDDTIDLRSDVMPQPTSRIVEAQSRITDWLARHGRREELDRFDHGYCILRCPGDAIARLSR